MKLQTGFVLIYAAKLRNDCKKVASTQGITYTLLMAKNNVASSEIAGSLTRYSSYCMKNGVEFNPNNGIGIMSESRIKHICDFTGMKMSDYLVKEDVNELPALEKRSRELDILVDKISYDTDTMGRVLLDIRELLRELLKELR